MVYLVKKMLGVVNGLPRLFFFLMQHSFRLSSLLFFFSSSDQSVVPLFMWFMGQFVCLFCFLTICCYLLCNFIKKKNVSFDNVEIHQPCFAILGKMLPFGIYKDHSFKRLKAQSSSGA